MPEQWLPVVGYEGLYEVSDQGRVRGVERVLPHARLGSWCRKSIIIRQALDQKGYSRVGLYRNGKQVGNRVHNLVLAAFVGPRPPGMEGCHADDIGCHNWLSNLRWDTRSANKKDAIRNGKNHQLKKTQCPQGHWYTAENTIAGRRGTGSRFRQCRTCTNNQARERHASKATQ